MNWKSLKKIGVFIAIIFIIYYLLFFVRYTQNKISTDHNNDVYELITKYAEHENDRYHGHARWFTLKKNNSILFNQIGYGSNPEGAKYFHLEKADKMYVRNDTLIIDGEGETYGRIIFPLRDNEKHDFYFSKRSDHYINDFIKFRETNLSKKETPLFLFTLSFNSSHYDAYISWGLIFSISFLLFMIYKKIVKK